MFGVNFGSWNNFQPSPVSFNPWNSWSNGFSTNPNVPFGGFQNFNFEGFTPQVGNQFSQNIFAQNDYVRRLQILQALGPGAERLIPNWRTMPFNDLLFTAARIRGVRPTNPTQNNGQNGQPLPLNVTARAYFDENQQIQRVASINIWELGGATENTFNNFSSNEVFARFNNGVRGREYRIEVFWENGRRFVIQGINVTGNVVVDRPNR